MSKRKRTKTAFEVHRLSDAAADPTVAAETIEAYIRIFNAAGADEWNESWTEAQVRRKLFEETAPEADRCCLTLWRFGGQVAGLSLALLCEPLDSLTVRDLPPSFQGRQHLEGFRKHLSWIAGPKAKLVVYRELGIIPEYRGGLEPIIGLVIEPLSRARRAGANFGCFWTSRRSRLYPLMVGYGLRLIYDFHDPDDHVFMGDDLKNGWRRFRTAPAVARDLIAERLKS
ncbi:hypothetical protein AMJ57_00455 [Parcubacteria bacterium SG8_24]|nr:MAG: hypothetical protein AMJ57_00455 [Parcubacteria bacterium SG8_24]